MIPSPTHRPARPDAAPATEAGRLLAAARFPIRIRGYDPVEVDALLDDVIVAVEMGRDQPAHAPLHLAQPDRLDEMGSQIARVLEAAEQRAAAMVAQARIEAERIVADAGAVFAAALAERARTAVRVDAARAQLGDALRALDQAEAATPLRLVAAATG